jgi:nicotinate-nucleotide--dimethylbenzimidazole phosphoribosyltransferase
MISGLPFDDIRNLARDLPGPDEVAAGQAAAISRRFGAVAGDLGHAAWFSEWLAAWTGRPPRIMRPVVALFAGTHGVAGADGNASVRRLVERCAAGGGAVNQACVAGDLGLKIFDLALDVPTGDITTEDALDEKAAAATIAFGMEAIAGGTDILVLAGYGGAGGSLSAAAVLAALHGIGGTDNGDIAAALRLHAGHLSDPLEVLRRLGGRETAALVGAILAARMQKVAVILDGEAALAAAAIVRALAPGGLSHCIAGDSGSGPASAAAAALGLDPVLRLGMTTGDGAGGAIAVGVAKACALAHAGAAEFLKASRAAG